MNKTNKIPFFNYANLVYNVDIYCNDEFADLINNDVFHDELKLICES